MSYQRLTPFAALGRPLEKQAFVQGMKDVGNGLWNAAAGKVNQRATQAVQGVSATTAGLGGLASGGFHGAGAAADKSWNSDQRSADREAARSTAGFSQAGAGLKSMGSAVGKYFSGIGNAVMGGGTTAPTPAAPKPVGAPPAATAPTQVAPPTPSAQPPTPAAPQQPDTNQFNQPGGWTTGPNGEIQPMQKQSAFAQLGKSAYANYQAMGSAIPRSAPAVPAPAPKPQFRGGGGTSPAAIAGRKSTGASPSAPPEVRNQVAAQAGVPAIMPDQIRAAASGPTAEHIAAFRKQTGTNFDPKSRMDMQNMRRLMGGAGTMDRKQHGIAQQLAGPQPTLAKTAFAQLEKEALAKGISKGLSWAGKGLSRAGTKAKRTAGTNSLQGNGFSSLSEARQHAVGKPSGLASMAIDDAKTAVSSTGNTRKGVGRALSGHADTIDGSKGIQNAINYGGGAAAAGAGLYGAHSMGHSSGREEGITEGVDQGMNLGLQGAQSAQPADPGFMGRLGDLFTGRQQGPDAATMRQGLSADRDKLIQSLMAR